MPLSAVSSAHMCSEPGSSLVLTIEDSCGCGCVSEHLILACICPRQSIMNSDPIFRSLRGAIQTSGKPTAGCDVPQNHQHSSFKHLLVSVSEWMPGLLILSHISNRKQSNNDDALPALTHMFSMCVLSHTSGSKGQKHHTGAGRGSGTSSKHSTGVSSTSGPSSAARAEGSSAASQGHWRPARKRGRDDDGSVPPRRPAKTVVKENTPRILCPFYVQDRHAWSKCFKHRFRGTADVRQHILRVHMQPPYCSVCGTTFKKDDARDRHIAEQSCERQTFEDIPGVSTEQFDRITEIGKQPKHHVGERERWLQMWRTLFDGEPDPDSPYATEDTYAVQLMVDVRNGIMNHHLPTSAPNTTGTHFDESELPTLDKFIELVRQIDRSHDAGTSFAESFQTPSGLLMSSVQIGQENSSIAPPSSSVQPSAIQLDIVGPEIVAANWNASFQQNHGPPLAEQSATGYLGWPNIHPFDSGEGSGQDFVNQALYEGINLAQFFDPPSGPYTSS